MEWMDKYREAPRSETALTIDRSMIIFLGLTILELAAGFVTFIAVMMSSDSILSIFVGLALAVFGTWLAREYRRRMPAHFLQHLAWSLGQKVRGVPEIFRKRRYVIFGP